MLTETILITRADGGVSVMQFIVHSEHDGVFREPSDANINAAIAKGGESVKSWRRIQRDELPRSREYRDAWKDEGSAVGHDMVKARDIHRDKLRANRGPKLAALDVAYQRADESGDTAEKARIVLEKQRLRDLPADPRIEQAETIEQLSAVRLTTNP